MSNVLLRLALGVSLLLFVSLDSGVAHAQPGPTAEALEQVRDDSKPIALRAQIIGRLLLEKPADGLEGLRTILLADETARELRLAIITGILSSPDFPLLSDLLGLYGKAAGTEVAADVAAQFRVVRSSGLARRLLPLASAEDQEPGRRVLVIRLLGRVALKEVVGPLIALWKAGSPKVVAEAARDALHRVIPERFVSAESAEAFWEENRGKDLQQIVTEAAFRALEGQSTSGVAEAWVSFAKNLLPHAPLDSILGFYLESSLWEIREMGAGRLADYPYAEREKAGVAEAKQRAAMAALDLLEKEKDPGVAKVILASIEKLVESAKSGDPDRALALLAGRATDPDRDVALAALSALGALGDPRASADHLCDLYDGRADDDTEFRLAILAAIESSGNGVIDWVVARLRRRDPDDGVMIRLLRILQNHKGAHKQPDCIPTIEKLFEDPGVGPKIRAEAASTLGLLLGNGGGDGRLVRALARYGLEDADPGVRLVSATMLRRATDVDDEVIQILRKHLGQEEVDVLVRGAAARSLLVLRRVSALEFLKENLADDALWQEVRNFLKADILAKGKAEEALGLTTALAEAKAYRRCAEASRMVLETADLPWTGEVAGGRLDVGFLLALSLDETGKSQEALGVLDTVVNAERKADPGGVEKLLLRARALRKSGAADKVAETLKPIFDPERTLPPGALARATLSLAHARIELGQFDAALKAITPLINDPDFGDAANALVELAERRRATAPLPVAPEPGLDALVKALDGEDADARARAVAALKAKGKEAHPALLAWLDSRKPEQVLPALAVIETITGVKVAYDPNAPEGERKKALATLREKLAG